MTSLADKYQDLDVYVSFDHCLAPGARVLTEDLRWLPIETLKVGDKLIAIDEIADKHRNDRKLRTAVVQKTKRVWKRCYRIKTDKDVEFVASMDHLWLSRFYIKGRNVYDWKYTRDLAVGDNLAYFCKPWEVDSSWEAGWISGLLDGEGSIYVGKKSKGLSCASLGFGQKNKIVREYAIKLLRKKGFGLKISKPSKHPGSFSPGTVSVRFNGCARAGLRALGTFRPVRLLEKVLRNKPWEGTRSWGNGTDKAVITEIEFVGMREVIALQTSTRTFIAEGVITHNSQLEIRVLAQMSGDKLLTELIQSGEDIHSAVGHEITGIPISKIKDDRDTRTAVKGIHFGIIYGLVPKSLYARLKADAAERGEKFNMTFEDVEKLYNRYFSRFAGVKKWLEVQVAFAQEHGYVRTLFGFRREISQTVDEDRTTFWRNQAVNSPIQGTAHQLLLISMAILEMKKKTYNLWQRMSMEIHDSLVAYVTLKDLPSAYKQGIHLLEKDTLVYVKNHWPALNWSVPLQAEAKAGFRMGVLVEKYAGEPPEEFLEKWCLKNKEFEKKMKKQMEEDAK